MQGSKMEKMHGIEHIFRLQYESETLQKMLYVSGVFKDVCLVHVNIKGKLWKSSQTELCVNAPLRRTPY